MQNVELLKVWLTFAGSLAWPIVVSVLLIVFRRQIDRLFERIKSGEFAGAKFNFNEAATGYIRSRIDDLAKEEDAKQRALLAGEIEGVATVIGAIHPISLAELISAATSPKHWWIGGAYTRREKYFDALEEAGLAHVKVQEREGKEIAAQLLLTQKGQSLLKSIGLRDSEIVGELMP